MARTARIHARMYAGTQSRGRTDLEEPRAFLHRTNYHVPQSSPDAQRTAVSGGDPGFGLGFFDRVGAGDAPC